MRPDDVRAALDALAAEQPDPAADVAAVMARGRRRVVQRRFAFVGIAAVLVAGIAIVGTISHTDHGTTSVSTGPPTTQVNTLTSPRTSSLFPTALEGWRCGNPMQYTDDGGQTWRNIALPAGIPANTYPCTALPGGNAWTTWSDSNGTRWHLLRIRGLTDMQVFPLPPVPANDGNASLTFVDVNHGWFLTGLLERTKDLYRTVDGGATWTLVAKNVPIGGVTFADANHGWSINGRALLGTTDGGVTWHTVAVPAPAGVAPNRISPVRVFAQGESVVVWSGTTITGSQLRPFFDVSNDGGNTWTLRAGPEGFELPSGVSNVFGPTDGSHWALTSGPELRITDDAGRTWQTRPNLPVPKNVSLAYPMVFPTPDVGWITTQQGVMWRTTDSGRTWTDITKGGAPTTTTTTPIVVQTQPIPIGLAFVSTHEGWICGDPPFYSTDGADTSWQFTSNWHNATNVQKAPRPATDGQQPLCAAVADGDAWFLYASPDAGRPFVDHVYNGQGSSFGFGQLPAGSTVVDLTFADATHGWALVADETQTSRVLYATRDGGQTFSVVDPNTPVRGSLHFTSATDGWAVNNLPGDPGTHEAALLHTIDGGRTWSTVTVPSPHVERPEGFGVGIFDLAVTPDAIVALGSEPTGELRPTKVFVDVSTDGGTTWALRTAPDGDFGPTEPMTFGAIDVDHWQFAVGDTLWTTANGGKAWTQVAQFAGSSVVSVQFVTPSAGYVSAIGDPPNASSSVALQTLDGGASWSTIAERAPIMAPSAAVVNYPGGIVGCPTHPLTTPPPGNPPSGLTQAAIDYVLQSRHWPDAEVTATYRVGTHTNETYAGIFAAQVASCGKDAVRSSWVVELFSQGLAPQGNVSQAQLALSYSSDGWHVFGFYH